MEWAAISNTRKNMEAFLEKLQNTKRGRLSEENLKEWERLKRAYIRTGARERRDCQILYIRIRKELNPFRRFRALHLVMLRNLLAIREEENKILREAQIKAREREEKEKQPKVDD